MYTIEDTSKNIGQNFTSWRKLLGLTAKQVAERAEISTVTYSKIENGASGASLKNILKVAKALGILEKILTSTDPYETDLGRARADVSLPKRVRR
jgi:transcriptional regulator with XRE-family HTH domain